MIKNKLILVFLFGILLMSLSFNFVIAQTYSSSTSSNFYSLGNDSSNIPNNSLNNISSANLVWLIIGIVLFLIIIYLLFRHKKKNRSRKKKL